MAAKTTSKPRDSEVSDPYIAARREWNERYGDYLAHARNWRLAAISSLIVSIVLAAGVVSLATQVKIVPYVVEVNKLGDAIAVHRADRAGAADARVAKASVAAWIADVRSVTSDPVAEKAALTRAYNFTASGATTFLNDYYRAHSPFTQPWTVAVGVDAVLPTSDRTYEVQWTEGARDAQGRPTTSTHWLARLTLAFDPPSDERGVLANPLGLYITAITWTQRL